MHSLTYPLHGGQVRVTLDDCTQAAPFDQCWQAFFGPPDARSTPDVPEKVSTLHLHLHTHAQAAASPDLLQPLWQLGDSTGWRTAQGFYLQMGTSALALDTAHGTGEGVIDASFWAYPAVHQYNFWLRTVGLLLRWTGIYGLHAGGVALADQAALIVGQSGSGKTTLMLSLVQAGWRYLADDMVTLRAHHGQIEAAALHRGITCTQQTLDFFPALRNAPVLAPATRNKLLINIDACFAEKFSEHTIPRLLLFPQITDAAYSQLIPLDETALNLRLIEQSVGLLVDARHTPGQLAVLRQLIQQTHSYRLVVGRDVYTEPDRVSTLLRQACENRG